MRFNEKEISLWGCKSGCEKEGRASHKSPSSKTYRERWLKLKGNILFYYNTNEVGAITKNEPAGALVIEGCRPRVELNADEPFVFSLEFGDDFGKKHYFSAATLAHCEAWVKVLQHASYERLRSELLHVRGELRRAQIQHRARQTRQPTAGSSPAPATGLLVDLT